jgi:hypothetical protein
MDEDSGRTTFMLMHNGNYPVYDITITILDETKMGALPFVKLVPKGDMKKQEWEALIQERDLYAEFMKMRENATSIFELSILTRSTGHPLLRFQIPNELQEQEYFVQIFSRNGKFDQTILCRRVNGVWRYSFRITKDSLAGDKTIVIREQIHPDIPISKIK